jgi:hypothetical protein
MNNGRNAVDYIKRTYKLTVEGGYDLLSCISNFLDHLVFVKQLFH